MYSSDGSIGGGSGSNGGLHLGVSGQDNNMIGMMYNTIVFYAPTVMRSMSWRGGSSMHSQATPLSMSTMPTQPTFGPGYPRCWCCHPFSGWDLVLKCLTPYTPIIRVMPECLTSQVRRLRCHNLCLLLFCARA